MELSDYYKDLSTDQQLADEQPPETREKQFREELNNKSNPADSLMYLGEKQKEVAKELSVVEKMLNEVSQGVTDALNVLMQRFGFDHFGICTFKMPRDRVTKDGLLLDEDGNVIENYGIKEITSESQRKKLIRDFEIAMMYMPHIKMQEMRSADKKDLILVTGISSTEFNAILRAHREKEKLTRELEFLGSEKEHLMNKLGLNTAVQVKSDGEKQVEHSFASVPVAPRDSGRDF